MKRVLKRHRQEKLQSKIKIKKSEAPCPLLVVSREVCLMKRVLKQHRQEKLQSKIKIKKVRSTMPTIGSKSRDLPDETRFKIFISQNIETSEYLEKTSRKPKTGTASGESGVSDLSLTPQDAF